MFQKNIPTMLYIVTIYVILIMISEVFNSNLLLFEIYSRFTIGWLLKILSVIAVIIEIRKTQGAREQAWSYILLFFMGTLIFVSRDFQGETFYFITFMQILECIFGSKYFHRRQQNQ